MHVAHDGLVGNTFGTARVVHVMTRCQTRAAFFPCPRPVRVHFASAVSAGILRSPQDWRGGCLDLVFQLGQGRRSWRVDV